MYLVEGRRQAQIASHLRIQQATISRMLKPAKDEEIVRPVINFATKGLYKTTVLEDEFLDILSVQEYDWTTTKQEN